MGLQKKLQQLNIPEREAQVYVTLLKLGLTRVGPIVNKTKLHRMLVYQSLEKLKDMHMASMVVKNGRQHWQATNPSVILDRIKKQESLAKEVVSEIELLKQSADDDVNVQIFYGRRGLIENLESLIVSAGNTDKILRIIGAATEVDFYGMVGDWYEEYDKLQKEHKVAKHLIAPARYTKKFEEVFSARPENKAKLMKEGLSSPTFTRITQEMVSIEIYGGKEPVIIQMRNEAIAQAYVEKFTLLWKKAKSVN